MLTPSDTSGERRGKRSSRKSRKRRKPCWLNCNKPIQLHDTRAYRKARRRRKGLPATLLSTWARTSHHASPTADQTVRDRDLPEKGCAHGDFRRRYLAPFLESGRIFAGLA